MEGIAVVHSALFLLKQRGSLTMALRNDYLTDLENAIRDRCRCRAIHSETVFVHEKTADNETVWFGDVEVFGLIDCKDARACYAWQNFEKGIQIVTILRSRIVDSPHRAVQAAIFSGVQPPMLALTDEAAILKERMEQAKKALYDAHIKAEDLEGVIQTIRRTGESIPQKWR
jgi:hypothetical protein